MLMFCGMPRFPAPVLPFSPAFPQEEGCQSPGSGVFWGLPRGSGLPLLTATASKTAAVSSAALAPRGHRRLRDLALRRAGGATVASI
jgi:hypothetical protein